MSGSVDSEKVITNRTMYEADIGQITKILSSSNWFFCVAVNAYRAYREINSSKVRSLLGDSPN